MEKCASEQFFVANSEMKNFRVQLFPRKSIIIIFTIFGFLNYYFPIQRYLCHKHEEFQNQRIGLEEKSKCLGLTPSCDKSNKLEMQAFLKREFYGFSC